MSKDFSYDPVTAISESEAQGQIKSIFRDIRKTMGIPILTSIWRGLARDVINLKITWESIKPMYRDNSPNEALSALINEIELAEDGKKPHKIATLKSYVADKNMILNIIKSYNRSNGLNFVTMHALNRPNGASSLILARDHFKLGETVSLPPLLERGSFKSSDWNIVEKINSLGTNGSLEVKVATLWRHLGYWPNPLEIIYEDLAKPQSLLDIEYKSQQIIELARKKSENIDNRHCLFEKLPNNIKVIIQDYINEPIQVPRMVILGLIIEKWIERWVA